MDLTEDGLQAFLREHAGEHWTADQKPFLLSLVATKLREQGQDYKNVLGEERLKSFVKRTEEAGGYRLVEHPTQKAKLGIVPSDVEFQFDETLESERPDRAARHGIHQRDRVLIDFLRALGRLPDELLDNVHIPTKVLVKLLTRR